MKVCLVTSGSSHFDKVYFFALAETVRREFVQGEE